MKTREQMIEEIKKDIEMWDQSELVSWMHDFLDVHLGSCNDEQLALEYSQFFGLDNEDDCDGDCEGCACEGPGSSEDN